MAWAASGRRGSRSNTASLAHEKDYSALLFLSGETPAALEASLQGLAGVLGIPDHETLKEDARRREVLDWLRLHPGWFLVIDNLDTPAALKAAEGLLAQMSEGHAVITTRIANFSAHFVPLELDVLSVDASVDFLEERTDARRRKTSGDEADARAIALDLGQLALALEHAGAYVAQKRQSFADYRKDWARQRAEVLGWHSDAVTGYPRSVADAFLLSFKQLTPAGHALLEHLAFLAPEPVPESLLDAPIPGFEVDASAALEEIDGYSLVKRDGHQATCTMHRLVQDVVRRGLRPEQADVLCLAALRWLIAAIDPARHPKPGEWRAAALNLGLHAEAVAAHATSDSTLDAGRYLLVETGNAFVEAGYLECAGRFQFTALEFATQLAERDPKNLDWQNNVALSRSRIGDFLLAQGNLPGALASFRAALTIVESLAKADPDNLGWQSALALSHNKLGEALVALGNLPETLTSYRAALTIAETLVNAHPGNAGMRRDLSVAHGKLGEVLLALGNLPGALASFRADLQIVESLVKAIPDNAGWRHDLSVSHNKIGEVLMKQGNLPGALTNFRAGLAIVEGLTKEDTGNSHWQHALGASYYRIGDALVEMGDLSAALKSLHHALAIAESLARQNPENAVRRHDLSISHGKIADVYVKSRQPDRAKEELSAGRAIMAGLVERFSDWAQWKQDLAWFDRQLAALGKGSDDGR